MTSDIWPSEIWASIISTVAIAYNAQTTADWDEEYFADAMDLLCQNYHNAKEEESKCVTVK